MPYLITSDFSEIQYPSAVLGCVPGYDPGKLDLHFDCPPNEILIDHLPLPPEDGGSILSEHWNTISSEATSFFTVASEFTFDKIAAAAWLEMDWEEIHFVKNELRAIALSEKSLFHPSLTEREALFGCQVLAGFKSLILSEFCSWKISGRRFDAKQFQAEAFLSCVGRIVCVAARCGDWPGT